ncbi:MAG: transglycosylase SLT domain-containing protein [Pikeienuella sp.]
MTRILIMALFCICASLPSHAAGPVEDAAAIWDAADAKRWSRVRGIRDRASEQALRDMADWRLLRSGQGDWPDYVDFVARAPEWPGLALLRREGERKIPVGTRLAEIDGFISPKGTQTGIGALRRAVALDWAGRPDEARAEIKRVWLNSSMKAEEVRAIRAAYGSVVKQLDQQRADNMAWAGLTGDARAMKPYLSRGWAALIEARTLLRRRASGVDGAIKAVPASLRNDPGLAFERFLWRMRKNRFDGALELIEAHTNSEASLGRPEEWSNRRRVLVRWLLRKEKYVRAYNLANRNHMDGGSDFADLEWLAGWIALRKLNDPDRAIAHFSRFLASVGTPISFGRGNYWLGRAHEAAKDQAGAVMWYERAAQYQTSFYGQLAAVKIGVTPDASLIDGPAGDWAGSKYASSTAARAAALLNAGDEKRSAHRFLIHFGDIASSRAEFAAIADYAMTVGRPDAAIRIAKKAARAGYVLRGYYYPLTGLARMGGPVEPALAMAIARQESELNPEAISPAGARGLMQLMPATAKKVSRAEGLKYSRSRLTSDWQYNATLGQAYLAGRLAEYGGSLAMAAAAYNAGPARVERWVRDRGDPRLADVDWIDWVEMIPFRETRNYVQRVLEGVQVYRTRIAGKPVSFRTEQDAVGK